MEEYKRVERETLGSIRCGDHGALLKSGLIFSVLRRWSHLQCMPRPSFRHITMCVLYQTGESEKHQYFNLEKLLVSGSPLSDPYICLNCLKQETNEVPEFVKTDKPVSAAGYACWHRVILEQLRCNSCNKGIIEPNSNLRIPAWGDSKSSPSFQGLITNGVLWINRINSRGDTKTVTTPEWLHTHTDKDSLRNIAFIQRKSRGLIQWPGTNSSLFAGPFWVCCTLIDYRKAENSLIDNWYFLYMKHRNVDNNFCEHWKRWVERRQLIMCLSKADLRSFDTWGACIRIPQNQYKRRRIP